MLSFLFLKELEFQLDEQACYDEIISKGRSVWFTAKNNPDGSLEFVKDKEGCQFYLGRLSKFPVTLSEVSKYIPDVNVENSYVTKCLPGYSMVPHKDANRSTAVIMPLGDNKGKIDFFICGKKVHTHVYSGPTLTRVDVDHSAVNTSNKIRYGITVEVPGSYLSNRLKRI